MRRLPNGKTKLCKFKKTATIKSLETFLLKQDCFHDIKSRLTTKKRKGMAQAKMKQEGRVLKREHAYVTLELDALKDVPNN